MVNKFWQTFDEWMAGLEAIRADMLADLHKFEEIPDIDQEFLINLSYAEDRLFGSIHYLKKAANRREEMEAQS